MKKIILILSVMCPIVIAQQNSVYIEQVGSSNTISIEQSESPNNYAKYMSTGGFNATTITQVGTMDTVLNRLQVTLNGSFNNTSLLQQSTGGSKNIYTSISDNSNSLIVQQKDSGNHFTEIYLTGGNKTVDVLQQGSAGHSASVTLSGYSTGASVNQYGITSQAFSLNFNCATLGGCSRISVTQGN